MQFDSDALRQRFGRALTQRNYNHFEMAESLGNPYGANGRAALALTKLSAA